MSHQERERERVQSEHKRSEKAPAPFPVTLSANYTQKHDDAGHRKFKERWEANKRGERKKVHIKYVGRDRGSTRWFYNDAKRRRCGDEEKERARTITNLTPR